MNRMNRIVSISALSVIAILCLVPPVYLMWMSLVREWGVDSVLPQSYTSEIWQSVWLTDADVLRSVAVSFAVSGVVALASTVLGFFCSRAVCLHPKRDVLLFAAYIPFGISAVMYAIPLHVFFIKAELAGTVAGVIVAQTLFALAFAVILFSSFWNVHVQDLSDLAATLGASPTQALMTVVVPSAREFGVMVLLQTFLVSWFQYGLTQIIGSGVVQTLPLRVYAYINEAHPAYAAVAGVVLIAPALAILLLSRRVLVQRL
jgi:putative spermidine/putrescine transport system permease protein